jgi:hypothetical protein
MLKEESCKNLLEYFKKNKYLIEVDIHRNQIPNQLLEKIIF